MSCEYCHQSPHDCRCPNAESEIIGACAYCGEDISPAWEYYTDNEENLFCSKECAEQFHGIEEVKY